jgi:hypothetical protein
MPQRIYFVHGHRVEEGRDRWGYVWWSCDCEDYLHSRVRGEPWCTHTQRVAAAVSIDKFLGSSGLTLQPSSC